MDIMDIFGFFNRHILGSIQVLLQQAIILQLAREKLDIKRLLLSTILLRVGSILSEQIVTQYSAIKVLLWIFMVFMTYVIIFKQSFLKSSLMSLGQMLLINLIEYACFPLFSVWGESEIYNNYGTLFVRLIATTMLIALLLICRKVNFNRLYKVKSEKLRLWILYIVFLLLFTTPNILNMEGNEKVPYTPIEIYNMVLFMMFFIYNAIYVRSLFKITDITQQLETQELYLQTLEQNSLYLRSYKHDQINIINSLGGLIEVGDLKGAEKFCRELGMEMLNVNNLDYINNELENLPQLRGIMTSKANLAALGGVEFRLSVPCEIKLTYCTSVDFCRIIGILLDNAMEAASKAERKHIDFAVQHHRGVYRIIIRNTCPEPVDLDRVFEKGYTTKGNHTGLGMYTIKRIVDKYRKNDYAMAIRTQYQDGEFTVTLTL